jgi:hypothetical protein
MVYTTFKLPVNDHMIPLIHRLLSLPDIDASHPGKEVVIIEIAGLGGGCLGFPLKAEIT